MRCAQQQPELLRGAEDPPKVGDTGELIFKEYISYSFK